MKQGASELENNIDELRLLLNKMSVSLIDKSSIDYNELLKISKKLDLLITEYTLLK